MAVSFRIGVCVIHAGVFATPEVGVMRLLLGSVKGVLCVAIAFGKKP
jgi:hypothetical protein